MSQSVSCILIQDKKALLIQRRDIPVWVLPGGGIEPGEAPEEAAVREMREETGLHVKIIRKVAEYTPINRLAHFTHFYEVGWLDGELTTGDETLDIRFFPKDQLPSLLAPPYEEWIEDAFQNTTDILRKKLSSVTYTKLLTTFLKHPILVIRFLLTKVGIHLNRRKP